MVDLNRQSEGKQQTVSPQMTIDLSDLDSLKSPKAVELRDLPHSFLLELNRGAIGHLTVKTVAGLFLLLPFTGGLIAVFGSAAQAQAYTNAIVTILESLTRLGMIIILPIITYYFTRSAK